MMRLRTSGGDKMKKITTLMIALITGLLLSTGVSAAYNKDTLTIDDKDMKLIWSDEFDGTVLNTNNWTYEIGNGDWGWGNNEQQYYTNSTENAEVSNGTLKIHAKYQSMGNQKYTSARIKTAGKVEVGNGYVVARIKLPSVTGIWPAFWMLGTNGKGWPMCGEIDIMESTNTNKYPAATMHWTTLQAPTKDHYQTIPAYSNTFPDFDKTQWHTYGVYRTEDKLRVFYDNRLVGTYTYVAGMEELKDKYYMLLNVAVGGNLTGNRLPSVASLPASMEVDYVRYYQDKTPAEIEAEKKAAEEAARKAAEEAKAKARPARAKILKIKNIKKRKISLTIKKITGIKGYQIRWCDNKRFHGYEQKNSSKVKVTLKGLTKKSKYSVKIRAYKVYKGKKIYGSWSKVKRIKINK